MNESRIDLTKLGNCTRNSSSWRAVWLLRSLKQSLS